MLAIALIAVFCGMAAAEQLYVNESGWWRDGGVFNASGTPIQAAVGAADVGDSIYVWNGSYTENVDVDKRLTLEGEGADVVVVTAPSSASIFEVTADYVNISGFAVRGTTHYNMAGIYLNNANHCNISGNNASYHDHGIYLKYSSDNTLHNNTANSNNDFNGDGIYLWSSCNNMLTGNTANSNDYYGICLYYSCNNTLTGNTANSNSDGGISVVGIGKNDYNNSIDTTNTVNGKPVYYFFNKNGIMLDGLDAGHLTLAYCSDCTIKNSNVSNSDGIYLEQSSNSMLQTNTASGNIYGIRLYHSCNNTLTGNTANSNSYGGIRVFGSGKNDYNNSIDTTNTVNGKPVYYFFNKNGIMLDGLDAGHLTLAYCSDCTIKNSNVSNSDGIYLEQSSNNTLHTNTASSNIYGIRLYRSCNNTLENNTASNNNYGIYLDSSSSYNTLTGNTANSNNEEADFLNDGCGIYMESSSNNTLTGNTANLNDQCGILLYYSSKYNTLTGNTANWNDRWGILLTSSYNTLINNTANSNNDYGIWLTDSSNNTLVNNTANSNSRGIWLWPYSRNNTLTGNTANSNSRGICLTSSCNNTLQNNTASDNYYGIYIGDADNNDINCNWVQKNTQNGFRLCGGSTDNSISYNNIIENGNYNATSGDWEWQFYNDQSTPVEAKHNYWGTGMNNSTIDASIYDDEEGGWGEVEFYPFETEPVQCPLTPEPPAFTTTDAVIALEIAVGSREYDPFWDISRDGRVTSLDALMILQTVAGL